jgi:AhpD family alkylhydroperoxidase
MSRPRIEPANRREAGVVNWTIAQIGALVTRTNPPNLFLTMAHQRRLFRGWLRFGAALMPRGKLPRKDTELVILRVAHLRRCAYEFEHHVKMGRRVGVTADDLERVKTGPSAEGWTAREQAELTAVDQLIQTKELDEPAWTDLREHLSTTEVVEFVLLVGHYDMLATFLNTLRVVPDARR